LPEILKNYKDDQRATFVLALTHDGIGHIEETVRRIEDNGNLVTFNYYSAYGTPDPLSGSSSASLLDEVLRVRSEYPDTVVSDEYFIKTLITGSTGFGKFSYRVCPSISSSHPAHTQRLREGGPALLGFNVYGADLETVHFCCTSGHCDSCRDSQAVYSWLLLSFKNFLDTPDLLETWIRIAEGYWKQFVWSHFHRSSVEDN
jgi:hypothetical protein